MYNFKMNQDETMVADHRTTGIAERRPRSTPALPRHAAV